MNTENDRLRAEHYLDSEPSGREAKMRSLLLLQQLARLEQHRLDDEDRADAINEMVKEHESVIKRNP